MENSEESILKTDSYIGERTAISGYKKQYDEFARRVYPHILDSSLVEIRVADCERRVGKLDDIYYETIDEIQAYQIKTTIVGDTFGYADFYDLVPKVIDGWKKIKADHPDKKVIPHLWTDKEIAQRSPVKSGDVIVDYFPKFLEEVYPKLKNGETVVKDWAEVVRILKSHSEDEVGKVLTEEEWNQFWKDFDFVWDYNFETLSVENAETHQRIRDLLKLESLIVEMAASKDGVVALSLDEIIKRLRFRNSEGLLFDHHLEVENAYYVSNQNVIDQLNAKVLTRTKGFVFLEGVPGSGKSTILTKWSQGLPNRCISYYAFDFIHPSHTDQNHYSRGESVTFLHDICKLIEENGIKRGKDILYHLDETFLLHEFHVLLKAISEDYQETGMTTIFIIDGLDHIQREYTAIQGATLLDVLPTPEELPEGVVFVLGSQYYESLGINENTKQAYRSADNVIKMPFLSNEEVGLLAEKILGAELATDDLKSRLITKSTGHPLYLRYILNQIKEEPSIDVDSIPDFEADIEVYYNRIVGDLLEKQDNQNYLGLLARVSGDIKDDWIREWNVSADTQRAVLKQMGHLFVRDKNTRTRTFFHNSFRQYLIRETGYDYISEEYSEERDKAYYLQLAEYIRQSKVEKDWSIGYYLYNAGADETYIQEISPQKILRQLREFRPIWHVYRDIEYAAQIAARKQDAYLMARILLLQHEVEQMASQEYDASVLMEEFLQLGENDIAKYQIQDGKNLQCYDKGGLELSRMFYKYEDIREAEFLFDSIYPKIKLPESRRTYNDMQEYEKQMDILHEWVRTAVYFKDTDKIDEEIDGFVQKLSEQDKDINDPIDVDATRKSLKYQVIQSLAELRQWNRIDPYVLTFPEAAQSRVRLDAYIAELQQQILDREDRQVIEETFAQLESSWDAMDDAKDSAEYLTMAVLAYQSETEKTTIAKFLDKVRWDDLDNITRHDRSSEPFDKLIQRIRYVELRTYLGYDDDLQELEPDIDTYSDEQTLIHYKRMVYGMAQLRMKAHREGSNDEELMSKVENDMTYFDWYWRIGSNDYAYMLSRHRGAFYEYIAVAASEYGAETVQKVGNVLQRLFDTGNWRAGTEDVRKMVCALYRCGIRKAWASDLLQKIEGVMYDGKDVYGKQDEALEQGKAWLLLGERERAVHAFQQMVVESLGVGYRKDFQPTTMARWISKANEYDKDHAIKRIHWLTSRLQSIAGSCEKRTAEYAGEELYRGALQLNIGIGVQLGKWLMEEKLCYTEGISSILVETLLERVQTKEEYNVVFMYFTQIHLCAMSDWSDVDTRLLEKVYSKGEVICGAEFGDYKHELRRCVSTQCYEKAQKELNNALDALETPGVQEEKRKRDSDSSDDSLRDSDKVLAVAREQLAKGEREEAWESTMDALSRSSKMGWAKNYDGGTRLNACSMLKELNSQEGRKIAFQQLAEDVKVRAIFNATGSLRDIVELLTDKIDEMRLYEEEQEYMDEMLREDTVHAEDMPTLEFGEWDVMETMTRWLIYFMGISYNDINDNAKMALARIANSGYDKVVELMREEGCEEWEIIDVGMYVRELGTKGLSGFKEVAKANADVNIIGLYARKILSALGEPVDEQYRELHAKAKIKDFSAIKEKKQPKPTFIPRITREGEWKVPDGWAYRPEECARLEEKLVQIQDGYIIGEKTYQCKPSDTPASEQFDMVVSYRNAERNTRQFFGISIEDEIIVENDENRVLMSRRPGKIKINSTFAEEMGWTPMEHGCSAWENCRGEKMAESVCWKNGNTRYTGRSNIETGEGWYVWVSKEAFKQIMTKGQLYVHRRERRYMNAYEDLTRSAYEVKEIKYNDSGLDAERKKTKMKVLVVSRYKEQMPEGCVPFIREQVEALRAQGCECAYYYINGKGVLGYLREIPGLRKKIREWKPDVIHAHYGLSCLVANLATRRVPVVSTYHGSDINVPSVHRFSKIAMQLSAWNIFVSKRNVDIAKPKKHWSLIPCGVALSEDQLQSHAEARKALGWSASDKKVLFTSAFNNAVKDPELAKSSVALLDGVELVELKGYSRQQVNTLMCASDCLLMTSKTEGSPQVIKEAMACGCPIVSVDVGDVAERTEGVEGCYVVPTREPKDIAAALKKAIAFKGKTNGREKILEYGLSNEQVAQRIVRIYEEIVKQ